MRRVVIEFSYVDSVLISVDRGFLVEVICLRLLNDTEGTGHIRLISEIILQFWKT